MPWKCSDRVFTLVWHWLTRGQQVIEQHVWSWLSVFSSIFAESHVLTLTHTCLSALRVKLTQGFEGDALQAFIPVWVIMSQTLSELSVVKEWVSAGYLLSECCQLVLLLLIHSSYGSITVWIHFVRCLSQAGPLPKSAVFINIYSNSNSVSFSRIFLKACARISVFKNIGHYGALLFSVLYFYLTLCVCLIRHH